jgi:surfeit locus 1 family protein
VFRLHWKLDLIARVDARVHAAPVAPPSQARWGGITSESDEYRRVALSGAYLYDLTTPVQALTEAGSGYWLLTPMCTDGGQIVIVNRGFIAAELGASTRYAPGRAGADPCARAGPRTRVTGLLRVSETGRAFMRSNDPGANRWYSRNVAAIAVARGLYGAYPVAPYFVDAAAGQNPPDSPDQPQGGLTVVNFHNSHLVYAITWYALALMAAGFLWMAAGRPLVGGARPRREDRER